MSIEISAGNVAYCSHCMLVEILVLLKSRFWVNQVSLDLFPPQNFLHSIECDRVVYKVAESRKTRRKQLVENSPEENSSQKQNNLMQI